METEETNALATRSASAVVLWADESADATALAVSLRDRGYNVEQVLTGSTEPIARTGLSLITGYGAIAAMLLRGHAR